MLVPNLFMCVQNRNGMLITDLDSPSEVYDIPKDDNGHIDARRYAIDYFQCRTYVYETTIEEELTNAKVTNDNVIYCRVWMVDDETGVIVDEDDYSADFDEFMADYNA